MPILRAASLRSMIAFAACFTALLPAARADDAQAVAWPAAHAGDHARYLVHECETRTRDDQPARPGSDTPRCKDHTVDVTVLAVDADGRARTRWIAAGPKDDYPLPVLEQEGWLARRAFAQGVPVELAIAADGHASLADAAAFRALLKRYAQGLAAAPARADAAQVQRLVQRAQAMSDAELLSAVDGAAKTLFLARVHPLVPGSSVDDVQTAVEPPLPMPVAVSRNVTVSALSPDGQALRQTTTRTLDGERAATLVKALVEATRARGAAPRDEEDARQALASQLGVHSVATTEIDLRSPWPASVSQVADMEFMHRRQHLEQAYTRQ